MCFEGGWVGARLVIPAEAGIHFRLVIPANAGIQFVFALRRFAITDSRPCAAWSPSMATRYFLLLVQEKVTKENTPSAPRPRLKARVRYGRTGSTDRPSMACSRIGAIPRAARVRGTRLIRPPFAAALEGLEERWGGKVNLLASPCPLPQAGEGKSLPHLRQGLPRFALTRDPLGRGEQAEDQSRQRSREAALFFGDFLLGKQKKVTGDHGWSTKHTRT